ncbi:p53-like transcription factor [Amniculicola lignicola CBS 123094]|uniref:p53-like transcription factor n=1 Tax=Amniculicola lignicola CBS 123094 TaxID=1392246 RepID=A0A6A5WCC7_9PLEO|nr:p53-like transcription factor [Amniculicola lignicola CBS 123094]
MSSRRQSAILDSPSAGMLPPARSPGMNHSVVPVLGGSIRDNYTTSTPGLLRHPHTLSPRHSDISRYGSLPDTPRSVLPTTMSMPGSTYPNPIMYPAPSDRLSVNESPPFNPQDSFAKIHCDQVEVTPTIIAKVDKGFFRSNDDVWTCYRRNYFSVSVSYTLHPWYSGGRLYLTHANSKTPERIYAMAVSLAAAVDGHTGKAIELIQHTPKRDKGPQIPMKKELLPPTPPGKSHDHNYGMNSYHQPAQVPGPDLPAQTETDSQSFSPTSHANSNSQHAFERIQFKSATANNGKRRAQQQYYHLIVELWANLAPREQEPRWQKIAACSSSPVVVRGRSPSHYQNEGPHNPGTSRGGGGSGLGGGGHSSLGPNGGSAYGGGYSNGLSSRGGSGLGGGMYRGNTYSLDPSPVGSHSVSSASSLSGGPPEGLVGDHQMVDDEDSKMMDEHNGYQYYPAPIYENIPSKIEGTAQPLPERRIKEEYPGPAAITTGWQVGGCGRFQGMETSRGYYPDVHAYAG